jgi:hypothetical protein
MVVIMTFSGLYLGAQSPSSGIAGLRAANRGEPGTLDFQQ